MQETPEHVAIVALGPSALTFIAAASGQGGVKAVCDEVWGINTWGGVLQCDRIFHMDDVRIQELRASNSPPGSKVAGMLDWMRTSPGPIYTSRSHPDYPGLVDFPLEEVIRSCGTAYFNSTAAYPIAYAIHIGVRKISLWGMDFTYPDAAGAEQGRGCVEYWMGRCHERGIQIHLPPDTSLMDNCLPPERKLYGYDTLDVDIQYDLEKMDVRVHMEPRSEDKIPTADEIERLYNHDEYPCRSRFPTFPRGGEALERLVDQYSEVQTVLDVGSGGGEAAEILREAGKTVTTVSYIPPADWVGDFSDYPESTLYDALWVSHTLEHQLNPNVFLQKCHRLLRPGGVLAVTVPPHKDNIVGGHVTMWNSGLLLYHLILAGFDCTEARVSGLYSHIPDSYPYNQSVIVQKSDSPALPELEYDCGDIEKLAQFFPVPVFHGFDGNINPVRW